MSESLREQYATDANLQARIALHARFSTAPDWPRWLLDRIAPPVGARILDVGCGPAALWKANLERIDPSWSLTLTDFSPGMIEAACIVLGDRAEYTVADVQDLPFADGSFDVVLANHMLYHVPERPKALAEIARVLVPGAHSMPPPTVAATCASCTISSRTGTSRSTRWNSDSRPAWRRSSNDGSKSSSTPTP